MYDRVKDAAGVTLGVGHPDHSHWSGLPTKHLGGGRVRLWCAVCVKYTLDFQNIVKEENVNTEFVNFYIDYMLKW